MSHIDKVTAQSRSVKGTTAVRRLRAEGLVPCSVYGHKQESTNVSVKAEELDALVRSGSRVVDFEINGNLEKVLVKDVQWDTFCQHVIHADFLRVDPNERIRLEVPLQLKGTAPGVVAGGVLEVPHHTVEIEALAVQAPDFILVKIGALGIGEMIHVRDLTEVPPGVKILTAEDTVLVQVVVPSEGEDPLAASADTGAQPALVGAEDKKEE